MSFCAFCVKQCSHLGKLGNAVEINLRFCSNYVHASCTHAYMHLFLYSVVFSSIAASSRSALATIKEGFEDDVVRKEPDTFNHFNALGHVMRAIWSVWPKCTYRCVYLK